MTHIRCFLEVYDRLDIYITAVNSEVGQPLMGCGDVTAVREV